MENKNTDFQKLNDIPKKGTRKELILDNFTELIVEIFILISALIGVGCCYSKQFRRIVAVILLSIVAVFVTVGLLWLVINSAKEFCSKIKAIKRCEHLPFTVEDIKYLGLNTFPEYVNYVHDMLTFRNHKRGCNQIYLSRKTLEAMEDVCVEYYPLEAGRIHSYFVRLGDKICLDDYTPKSYVSGDYWVVWEQYVTKPSEYATKVSKATTTISEN